MGTIENFSISYVTNVSISSGGQSISQINMNICALITSDKKILNSTNRVKTYINMAPLAQDFGSGSTVYTLANTMFAQDSNFINSGGGYLVVGYWRAVDEKMEATNAYLQSAELNQATVIQTLQQVKDGSFCIAIDGEIQEISELDFTNSIILEDIVKVISSKLNSVNLNDTKIVINSPTFGNESTISFVDACENGTYVGEILGLNDGSGALIVNGKDEYILEAESQIDALNAISKLEPIRGAMFIDKPTSKQCEDLSDYAKANDILVYDVFSSDENFKLDTENFVWKNKLKSGVNYRTLFDKNGDRKFGAAYMSRMHSVNFSSSKTAITMHLKNLAGVLPSSYDSDEINKAQNIGLDIYGSFGGIGRVYSSGANDFTDNIYNLIAIKYFTQIDYFNTLSTSNTKLSQTDEDMEILSASIENTMQRFVKVGVIAPGSWNSADSFGDVALFKRNIQNFGYTIFIPSMSTQSQSERETRKAPVAQVAFKMAGAIHSANIIINFER